MYSATREYEATILVKGRPVTEVEHGGRVYIEGRKGSPYELRFTNNTSERVLVVPSVDGLSVIDGKPAGVKSSGYVVDAHGHVTIRGWTVDHNVKARFEFGEQTDPRSKSKTGHRAPYAEQMGHGENQGLIGFMVFKEKPVANWTSEYENIMRGIEQRKGVWPPIIRGSMPYHPDTATVMLNNIQCSATGAAAAASGSSRDDPHMGTLFGKAIEARTRTIEFERKNPTNPEVIFVFYYDSLRNLKKRGVPVEKFQTRYDRSDEPNPFPASPKLMQSGCKPPPGWKK